MTPKDEELIASPYRLEVTEVVAAAFLKGTWRRNRTMAKPR
jgi:hypothetical protein